MAVAESESKGRVAWWLFSLLDFHVYIVYMMYDADAARMPNTNTNDRYAAKVPKGEGKLTTNH